MRVFRREVRVGGKVARYRVAGEGDPIVLVHGLAGSSLWWIRNLGALAAHYRVHLVDLPGFGGMSWPRQRFVLSDSTDWLLAWMDAIGLSEANLVGHSMGGLISLRLASRYPKRVKRLVLAAPAVQLAGRSIAGNLLPVLRAGRHGDPLFYPIFALDSLRAGPLTLLQAARQLVGEMLGDLTPMERPTLLVWGSNDTIVPARGAVALREQLPESKLVVIKGAGHVVMFDRAQEFNSAVLDFLAGKAVGE